MNDTGRLPTVVQLGDHALLVTFAHVISWQTGVRVRAAARRIRAIGAAAISDVVPAYTTLAVYTDDTQGSIASIVESITSIVNETPVELSEEPTTLHEIPVTYDGADIEEVARRTGLTVGDVVERHAARTYRAYMSGFVPGFTYLGDLDESLVLARRTVPRVRVPAGSVAIAGAQTAVYPLSTPGGWHIIGSTSTIMFDASRVPPALICAGDAVRFVPTTS